MSENIVPAQHGLTRKLKLQVEQRGGESYPHSMMPTHTLSPVIQLYNELYTYTVEPEPDTSLASREV